MNDSQNLITDVAKDSPLFSKLQELFQDVPRVMSPREHFTQQTPYPQWPECSLELKWLQCLKKNEFSKDEIRVAMFHAESGEGQTATISNVIMVAHDFRKAGETFDMNIRLAMPDMSKGNAFFIMIYEEDNPAFFDPDDPIGLIAFYPNQAIAAFSGNFFDFPTPLTYSNPYNKDLDITLDAGSDGNYCMRLSLNVDQ